MLWELGGGGEGGLKGGLRGKGRKGLGLGLIGFGGRLLESIFLGRSVKYRCYLYFF